MPFFRTHRLPSRQRTLIFRPYNSSGNAYGTTESHKGALRMRGSFMRPYKFLHLSNSESNFLAMLGGTRSVTLPVERYLACGIRIGESECLHLVDPTPIAVSKSHLCKKELPIKYPPTQCRGTRWP